MTDFPAPQQPIRAVTFDLDGLMFNTEHLYQEVDHILLDRRGKQSSQELLDQMMGRKADVALQLMIDWHGLGETVDELYQESREIMFRLMKDRLEPMPGLLALLDGLESAGIPKGIATSSRRQFAHTALDKFELRPRFSFVLTCEDIEHGKPAPDVYQKAARQHDMEPAAMMILEDSQIGSQAGVASGAYTVAVPAGSSLRHKFDGVQFMADTLCDERIYQVLGISIPTE